MAGWKIWAYVNPVSYVKKEPFDVLKILIAAEGDSKEGEGKNPKRKRNSVLTIDASKIQ